MIRRRIFGSSVQNPSLDMSSLIDVSFLLLIYFIATSTLMPKEADLDLNLIGHPTGGREVVIDPMEISISGDGAVIVNDELLDTDLNSRTLPLLKNTLAQYKTAADLINDSAAVILDAEDSAKSQRFVDVLNTIAEVDIDDVTLKLF